MSEGFEENVIGKEIDEADAAKLMGEIPSDESPLKEENEAILGNCTVGDYEAAFQKVFLEILDYEKGLYNAKENFTNALLNTGSKDNPQDVYEYMDMLSSRLAKIHIVKRLCGMLGLHGETDDIVNHEMELIYNRPTKPRRSVLVENGVVAGDIKRG